MPSWSTEDEKQLLLTIIDLLHINKLPNWVDVSSKLGRGYSHEACRQHFQKLRRNPNSSSPSSSTRSPTKSRIQKQPSTPRTPSKRKIQQIHPSPSPPPPPANPVDDDDDDDDEVVESPAIAPPDNAPGNESPTKKLKTEEESSNVIRRPVFKHEGNYVDLEEDEDLYAS